MPQASESKRGTVENPFIKPENRKWHITDTASFKREISPPISKPRLRRGQKDGPSESEDGALPSTAAVNASEANVIDQLAFWVTKLQVVDRRRPPNATRLIVPEWKVLYSQHAERASGSHFVVHQHDHPVAGTHYDLRLQCNPTSSISFAIMYGLPGDPNSRKLNRNATETRVHCLWNHLIETASMSTGSMLIWDTGHYEVLSFKEKDTNQDTDDESDSYHVARSNNGETTEQQKLRAAFQSRRIRLRLHGTRLPNGYTISLRLTKENYRSEQPNPPSRKRKRKAPRVTRELTPRGTDSGSSPESDKPADIEPFGGGKPKRTLSSLLRHETPPLRTAKDARAPSLAAENSADPGGSDHEAENQEEIRKNNAYPGATNDIGSIHQRKWYLSMDRRGSGFVPSRSKDRSRVWIRKNSDDGFNRFHVLGREIERSVVTGRLAGEILEDEGIEGFVPRGLWRGLTE